MLEIARQLEQTAIRFNPAVLIVPGVVCVLLGLFVWLGGLGFRRTLVAIVGAVSGGICGFFVRGRSIVSGIVSAGVAAVIAIVFERMFIIVLTGILVAVLSFAVLAGPYFEDTGEVTSVEWDKSQNLSIQQTVETANVYIADFATEAKRIFIQMPVYDWIIMAVLAVVFLVMGFFQWRLASAFCCAALGVMLVVAGMILLLLYKGAAPISRIFQSRLYYMGIFAAMIAFGITGQLLLCRRIKEKLAGKKDKNKDEKVSVSWRGE